jgi:dTDP-4-dehydrorhamnose 3,5-epimerase
MVYKTSHEYVPASDRGVLWSSFGYDWPAGDPIVSDRDRNHPPLAEFSSPF